MVVPQEKTPVSGGGLAARFTPSDLAALVRPTGSAKPSNQKSAELSNRELEDFIEKEFPELFHLLPWLGYDSIDEALQEWLKCRDRSWVSQAVTVSQGTRWLYQQWLDVLNDSENGALAFETLVFESNLCRLAAQAARDRYRSMRYAKTLHVVRQRVALTLWKRALNINWQRPVVFCRILRLARNYLIGIVRDNDQTDSQGRYQFSGRLGQCSVLLARFEPVITADLQESARQIDRSIHEGNSVEDAVPYLLESFLRLHDNTGDRQYLGEALKVDKLYGPKCHRNATWRLHVAEIYLRLADGRPQDDGTQAYLDKAEQALLLVLNAAPDEEIRLVLLRYVLSKARSAAPLLPHIRLGLRYLKNHFSIGEHFHRFAEAGHPAASFPAELMLALEQEFASSTDPLVRRLLSDCLRAYSELPHVSEQESRDRLRQAIGLQEGEGNAFPLTDELSRLRYADDLLKLAYQGQDRHPGLWAAGTKHLIKEAVQYTTSSVPLIRLGRDAEQGVAITPKERSQLLDGLGSVRDAERWVQAVDERDANFFYREAARRASSSPDLVHRNLGGRSNVVTVEDHLGFTSSTFVFKPTTEVCFTRDEQASAAVNLLLIRMRDTARFGISEHITTIPYEETLYIRPKHDKQLDHEIVTVRRFEHGRVLADLLSPEDPGHSLDLLKRTAVFLAYIHSSRGGPRWNVDGIRKGVRKEVHLWLRGILANHPTERAGTVFDAWWSLLDRLDLPAVPRRDAHAFNWLVTDDERIVAVDLEATNHRPLGYELAQMTDDVPALPAGRWDLRRHVVEEYMNALSSSTGEDFSGLTEKVWESYRVALLARAVRGLSSEDGTPGIREHAEAMLDEMSEQSEWGDICTLATRLRDIWAERRGTHDHTPLRQLREGRRRRISRTLAYLLRHNTDLAMDEYGWSRLSDVVRMLAVSDSRLGVSAEELIRVSLAVEELRFEVRNGMIRARYGHSRPVLTDHEPSAPDGALYHSTAVSSLGAILERGEGLRPMSRLWVHMTTDRHTAIRVGRRHGPSVLLALENPDSHGLDCRFAGGTTWLIAHVPASSLRVVPLYELFSTQ